MGASCVFSHMVYRDDVGALEARLVELEAQVGARTRERDEVAGMVAEARTRERQARVMADIAAGGPARRRRRAMLGGGLGAAIAGAIVAVLVSHHKPSRIEDAMDGMQKFTDRMCACQNASCASKVEDELTKWATEMRRDMPKDEIKNIDAATQKRLTEIMTRFSTCTSQATTPRQ